MHEHETPAERLLELALQEKLGGKTPPNLADRILAAAEGKALPATGPRRAAITWLPFAVAASLLAVLAWGSLVEFPAPEHQGIALSDAESTRLSRRAHGFRELEESGGEVTYSGMANPRDSRELNRQGQPDGGYWFSSEGEDERAAMEDSAAVTYRRPPRTELPGTRGVAPGNEDHGGTVLIGGVLMAGNKSSDLEIGEIDGETNGVATWPRGWHFAGGQGGDAPNSPARPDLQLWNGQAQGRGANGHREDERLLEASPAPGDPFAPEPAPASPPPREGERLSELRKVLSEDTVEALPAARHLPATAAPLADSPTSGKGAAADFDALSERVVETARPDSWDEGRRRVRLELFDDSHSLSAIAGEAAAERLKDIAPQINGGTLQTGEFSSGITGTVEPEFGAREIPSRRQSSATGDKPVSEGNPDADAVIDEKLPALVPRVTPAQIIGVGADGAAEVALAKNTAVQPGNLIAIANARGEPVPVVVLRVSGARVVVRPVRLAPVGEQVAATPPPAAKPPAADLAAAQGAKKKAESVSWKPAKATPNASQLMIGDHEGLPLVGMQASVQIDGFRARVVTDYYYHNDRERQLEGTFKLRLPSEAALYYFAFGESAFEYQPQTESLAAAFLSSETLRSGGSPAEIFRQRGSSWKPDSVKEARVVPREQAAYAYSETTRRRIDPALVEWAGAGVFQARVFPLAAGQLHRVVVGYDVPLAHERDDLVYRFALPENRGQCAVDLNVARLPARTATIVPEAAPFVANNRLAYHFANVPAAQPHIEVRLERPGALLLAGADAQAGPFFATELMPNLPAEAAAGASRAVFLLDGSLSSRPERFQTYVKLLEKLLAANRPQLQEFSVVAFQVEARRWREGFVPNTPENAQAAVEFANSLALEGATDLAAALRTVVPEGAGKAAPATDVFLLSDGHATWGETSLAPVARELSAAGATVFAYHAGGAGNALGALDFLARETGGAVFAVPRAEEIEAAATAHRKRPWHLASVTLAGGSDLLTAGCVRHVYPGQRLQVVGRGTIAPGSEVLLHFEQGETTHAVRIPVDLVVPSDLAPRAYGQVAVAQLEELADATSEVAVAFARHFRVTGESCSLLMLESEADYERFKIGPADDTQNALVVTATEAGGYVARKLDELGMQLASPKRSFLAWLARLEQMPAISFRVSTPLKLALESMPESSFATPNATLVCRSFAAHDLPEPYRQALASESLGYETALAEARRRGEKLGSADALKAASSLIEQSPGDVVLLRDLAFSALEWKLPGQAIALLQRAAAARPYEPQTYLALARALGETGRADLALVYYELALGGTWDSRFGDFHAVAQVEYLRLLREIKAGSLACSVPAFAAARYEELSQSSGLLGADLVVTMQWNVDRTDVDLHVVEPSGEDCHYGLRDTKLGGHMTSDVTQGFGPEMYTLKKAAAGKYVVNINYFGSDQNRTQARAKAFVSVYRHFGTDGETATTKAITLSEAKEQREAAVIEVE